MDAIRISDEDARDPKMLRQHLNALFAQTFSLLQRIEQTERDLRSGTGTVGGITERERSILRSIAIGSTENPIASQTPVVPTVTAFPPVNVSTNGQLLRLASDGILYIFDSSIPDWIEIGAAAAAHSILSATHSDSLAAAVVRGDLIIGNSTPKWARLTKGTANQVLRMDGAGADPGWGTVADGALSANVVLESISNTFAAGQAINALAGLLLGGTIVNGAAAQFVWSTEEVTLSTVGATTDSTAFLIPGSCLVLLVAGYVTQTISGGGVTNVQIGDATSASHFFDTANLNIGNAFTGMDQWAGGVAADADGPLVYGLSKVRLTAVGGTPTQGKLRLTVLALAMTPPTS